MVSLRFPFSFPQPPKLPNSSSKFPFISAAAAAAVAISAVSAAAVIISDSKTKQRHPFIQTTLDYFLSAISPSNQSFTFWASLSLADGASPIVEPKTGSSFPSVLHESKKLLGIGLRRKCVFGLKNIDVYAFGVYADDGDVKRALSTKYRSTSADEFRNDKDFIEEIMQSDISMTVRLQIVYGRLSIGSVRSAFEDSVGSRLQKFGGPDNKELLNSFTSQFKDEIKIPKGSVIELSREPGHVMRTTIDGKEVGSIQSKLLCRSILDLYIGEDPFDKNAKEEIELKLGSLLQE